MCQLVGNDFSCSNTRKAGNHELPLGLVTIRILLSVLIQSREVLSSV